MGRICVSLLPLLVTGALIAGCAQLPFTGPSREQGNSDAFEALGRVYVRYGSRGFSGSLRWLHAPESDEVWLGGPLGQTGAYISRDSTGASLTTADQKTYRAMSMESLTREGLGWSLPLADLSYYVMGSVPADIAASAERDSAGRLTRAEREGWTVRWSRPDGKSDATPLSRLNLAKDNVEIRFVVDRLEPMPR